MKIPSLVIAAGLLLSAVDAYPQALRFQLDDGLVTLDAQDVLVGEILEEWARVGAITIVNGDKLPGGPVTIQLEGVPERLALDTLLRGASGYIVGARPLEEEGRSSFDRILILPVSKGLVDPPQNQFITPLSTVAGRTNAQESREEAPAESAQPVGTPAAAVEAAPVPPAGPVVPVPVVATTPGNPFGVPTGSGRLGDLAAPTEPAPPPYVPDYLKNPLRAQESR